MSTSLQTPMIAEPGVRFGIANGLVVGAMLVAGLARLGPAGTTALVIGVAGLGCAGLRWWQAAALGVIGWAILTGFAVHQYGVLTFTGPDLRRLVLVVLGTTALAELVHAPAHHPRGQR